MFERQGVSYLPTHKDGPKLVKLLRMVWAYLRFAFFMLTGQVGLVHAHVASRASFWRKAPLLRWAQQAGVPTVVHLHGAEFRQFYEDECSSEQQQRIRKIFECASLSIGLSDVWSNWIANTFPGATAIALPNPIEVPPEENLNATRDHGVVLSLGELGHRKGTFDLIRATASMPPEQRWHLRLGGNGEVDAAGALAVELGMRDHLHLLGWITGADKARELSRASVYALPSYNEGLPMSLLEAMAHGLPVVATPVGGIPEAITDGVEGFLIPPGDVEALKLRLQQLCENPAMAARMGAAARQKAIKCFSAAALVPKLEKIYTDLRSLQPACKAT